MPNLVWDNHICVTLEQDRTHIMDQLRRHKAAGFTTGGVNINYADRSWEDLLNTAEIFVSWIGENASEFAQVKTVEALDTTAESDLFGLFFNVEGAAPVGSDLGRVEVLQALGVRWMCLTYNVSNRFVGGCLPGEEDHGLTDVGRDLVTEMNRQGITVCCSHTGARSARDIIEHSSKPVIFSHSNANAVFSHWRNIDDDLVLACAAKGGVACVNGVGPFLEKGDARAEVMVAHVLHMINLVGAEHVGLGFDYVYDQTELEEALETNADLFTEDMQVTDTFTFVPPESLPSITSRLSTAGLSDHELRLVLGENLRRVAQTTWQA